MAWAELEIYLTSVATANRRDQPYAANTTGTVINLTGGSILDWADDNDRRGWGRIDGSYYCYYELEVTDTNEITVYMSDELGDTDTAVHSVSPGATYTDLVHGVSIELHSSLTIGHKARVYPAIFALDDNTMYLPRGEAGDNVAMYVYNSGTITHKLAELRLGRGGWFSNDTNTPLDAININLDTVIADTYAVTIAANGSNWDVTFTGSLNTYEATDVAAGATDVDMDDTATTGITFDLNAGVSAADEATVYISDFADGLELAPDSSGSPGTWVEWSGTTGLQIPLNRAGYSDQQIPASQSIACWLRWNGAVDHPIGRGVARLYTKSYQAET